MADLSPEEQRQKEAVTAMRGAQAAMRDTLARVDTVERALARAKLQLQELQKTVGADAYMATFENGSTKTVRIRDFITAAALEIDKVLV